MIRPFHLGGLSLYSYPERVIALKGRHARLLFFHSQDWMKSLLQVAFPHLFDLLNRPWTNLSTPRSKLLSITDSDPIKALVACHSHLTQNTRRALDLPQLHQYFPLQMRNRLLSLRSSSSASPQHVFSISPQELNEDPLLIPSAKTAFQIITRNLNPSLTPMQHEIQSLLAPSSDLLHLWKNLKNTQIDARIRRIIWNISTFTLPKIYSDQCPRCAVRESTHHIFFECPRARFAVHLFKRQASLWRIRPPDWNMKKTFSFLSSREPQIKLFFLISATFYICWYLRNLERFNPLGNRKSFTLTLSSPPFKKKNKSLKS